MGERVGSERVALIDGTGLVYRAWFALPRNLQTRAGLCTNAVYGFALMFRKLLAGRTPRYGAVVFDSPSGRAERTARFAAYKAQRAPMPDLLRAQLPWIDQLVAAHGYPTLRVPGVEADDVIGTLTARALRAGHEVWIVSGDKDFAQLVGDRVRLFDSTREVVYGPELVFKKWGVPPERFADWLALVGDASDNVPGVPGIGGAGAAELLARHGDLEGVLRAADDIPGRAGAALRRHREQARLSRGLVGIRVDLDLDVDLEDLAVPEGRPEPVDAVYRELEFFSLLSAAPPAGAAEPPEQWFVSDTPEVARAALARECQGSTPVGLHLLTEFSGPPADGVVGVALCPREGFALYFPFRGPGTHLGREGLRDILGPWLADAGLPKLVHGYKDARVALARQGVGLHGVVGDTALASYLLDPTRHLPHRLEQVVRAFLERGVQPVRSVLKDGRTVRRFEEVSISRAGGWACLNAGLVRRVWEVLRTRLLETPALLEHLFDIDLPLAEVLARMELAGIAAQPEAFERLEAGFRAEQAREEERIHALAGRAFNPGSLKQLGEVLFEELRLPVLKRTKTGYGTDADVLARLAHRHPIIEPLLRWREITKLIDTYTSVLRASIGPDGRIHPVYQQTVAASGRVITTEPDLQRTPVRTEESRQVRAGLVAPAGARLVSADWSQIELRILAHASEDERLVGAFLAGDDVHAATACELFGVSRRALTSAQREVGKTINFATIYGQGAAALARQLRVDREQAAAWISTFFQTYRGVQAWRERTVEAAVRDGYVTTLLGRRRYLPELSSNNHTDRAYGERIAVNTPIQGSGADLCKLALVQLDQAMREQGLGARIVLQIHDEILCEAPEAEVEEVGELARRVMESVITLRVPLVVDVGVGPSWADAH